LTLLALELDNQPHLDQPRAPDRAWPVESDPTEVTQAEMVDSFVELKVSMRGAIVRLAKRKDLRRLMSNWTTSGTARRRNP